MLPPEERSVLTDTVHPPPGCVLDRAVALTYSLNLESALVVPLAFAGQVVRESQDPVAVMEAVRNCADRVDVFCQAGQVTVPQRGTDLLAFLEPVVHLVRRPRPGRLFHPKLWALRFRDASSDAVHTRLVVLSRNLTADRTSWDVCLRLDGAVGTRTVAANRPLVGLLRRTIDLCVMVLDDDRRSAVTTLADDLLHTSWDLPEGVRGLSFFTLGVPGQTRPDFVGTRHLVVSPFVNEKGLAFTKPAGGGTVIGTQEELDRLPESALDGCDVYVINALADITAGDDADRSILTGLHAKLYVVEKGQTARVLVGSANATDAAFGGNVEILAELTGGRRALGIDAMVGADAGFRRVLEPYQRGAAITEDADDRALADLIRDLAAVPLTATVEPTGDSFAIRLSSDDILPAAPESARITAELVTRRGDAATLEPQSRVDARFPGLAVVDVTPFVVVTAQDHRGVSQHTVVHAQLIGDPAGRFDEVIARQVDTPEKFLRFLALLLGLFGETSLLPGAGDGSGSWAVSPGSGVLEMLLRGLVDRRTQLDDLARLVTRLESTEQGRKVLPHGFAELWQVVDAVRRDLAAEEVP